VFLARVPGERKLKFASAEGASGKILRYWFRVQEKDPKYPKIYGQGAKNVNPMAKLRENQPLKSACFLARVPGQRKLKLCERRRREQKILRFDFKIQEN